MLWSFRVLTERRRGCLSIHRGLGLSQWEDLRVGSSRCDLVVVGVIESIIIYLNTSKLRKIEPSPLLAALAKFYTFVKHN